MVTSSWPKGERASSSTETRRIRTSSPGRAAGGAGGRLPWLKHTSISVIAVCPNYLTYKPVPGITYIYWDDNQASFAVVEGTPIIGWGLDSYMYPIYYHNTFSIVPQTVERFLDLLPLILTVKNHDTILQSSPYSFVGFFDFTPNCHSSNFVAHWQGLEAAPRC